ncbi:MAG: murein biosynthesis integral membrane protein MurJ [Pseudomonadota bacterium]|jgi:putative peptidoglycan lipid II flippase
MKGNFLRNTSIVGAMTLLSRVTGMLRDMVYARMFGAGPLMDAFIVAFKIPNFLRRITGEGAFSQAFVPVINEYRIKRPHEDVDALVAGVMGTLGWALFAITLVGVVASPFLVVLFAPGFAGAGGRSDLAGEMLRWTFPYIFFISLTALGSGVLNSYGKFGTAAFNPVILNVVMILFAAWIAPHSSNPGVTLAIGVFVAGVVQLAAQFRGLQRLGLLSWPRWRYADPGVRRIARLMLPGIFGSSVAQIAQLLDTWIASFFVTGSLTWMYYAVRLAEFPMGVFSIALATVILPGLSVHHSEESPERFNGTLDWALRLTSVISLPASVALFVLAGPLIATINGYGKFGSHDVLMSAYALMSNAAGLMGLSLVKVLLPGYTARQDTRTPVRIGITALSVAIGFDLLVVIPAAYFGAPVPHAILALSSGIGAYVNCWLLYRGLREAGIYRPTPGWKRLGAQLLVANVVMALFLWWAAGAWEPWTAWSGWLRVGRLTACVVGGATVYGAVLWIMGLRPRHLRPV